MYRHGAAAIVAGLALACLNPRAAAQEPIAIGPEPQLFVDDFLIGEKSGVQRHAHPCTKLPHPVLEPERPWEGQRVYVYGTVLRNPDTGQFRLWYMATQVKPGRRDPRLNHAPNDLVLYATSTDGIRWSRPELGLYEYEGSKANNIVYDLSSPSVIFDPADPDPSRRYKMLGVHRAGRTSAYWAAYSADGIHWNDYPANPVLRHSDTITLAHDRPAGQYLAFHKITAQHGDYRRRLVWLATSPDFQDWSKPTLVMAPDAADDAWARQPGQRTEFYNMAAFPYGGQFLGLVTVFKLRQEISKPLPGQSPHDGPIDVQLTCSRDGRTWHRCEDRNPVIPNGPHPYDAGCILGTTNLPVIVGDQIWFYYTAITTTHGGALPKKRITIARAAWRLDGFVSLDAGSERAVVQTRPLLLPRRPAAPVQLLVNADASQGELAVAVVDAQGNAIPGFGLDDCLPLRADSVRHTVRWKTRGDLGAHAAVRLRFVFRNTRLYSFQVR